MNKLCNIATSTKENAIGTLDREQTLVAKTIYLLSVGSVDRASIIHDALLYGPKYHLTVATNYRQLWELPLREFIQVAVLADTLSSFELEAACQLIRRRWPHTKILIIRGGAGYLDDALYDDCVASTVTEEVFLTVIERFTRGAAYGSAPGATRWNPSWRSTTPPSTYVLDSGSTP
ncbi:MAG: hypothetical protein WAN35_12885 [Terracidiphilus sp.]|jgi:hypothetical protein